ncbi:MAG: sensor histidine kinase [Salinirussus sp.]
MALGSAVQLSAVAAASSLGFVLFGLYLLARHQGVGVRSLSAFAIVWGVNFVVVSVVVFTLATYGITSGTQLQGLSSFPGNVQLLLISSAPLTGLLTVGGIFVWLWFVLRYTRRIEQQERLSVLALGGLTFVVATANGLLGALRAFGVVRIPVGLWNSFTEFATVVEVLGTGVAVGVGVGLLYVTSQRHRPFTGKEVIGLSLPIVLPYLLKWAYQFQLIPGFRAISGLRSVALLVGLGGMWLTVTRYGLFDQLPASRTVGRQTAFDATDAAIVVVNNDNDVSDLNPAAREMFGADDEDVIGSPLDTILPETIESADIQQPRSVTFEFPGGDTIVEVETTKTTDGERLIGQTLVFNEITEERRRQQRIQVLNRVLRHNLRNDISAATGYVDAIADGGTGVEEYRVRVQSILHDLVEIGNKAREIEEVLSSDPLADTPFGLQVVIEDAVAAVEADHGDIDAEVDVPATALLVNPAVLEPILDEVIDNAVEHADASTVRITYDPERTTLTVADDGPGIPDHEVDVLESARETALQHGSGLGLWLIKWGTELFGGSVAFETDGSGTQVRIRLPPDLVGPAAQSESGAAPEDTPASPSQSPPEGRSAPPTSE